MTEWPSTTGTNSAGPENLNTIMKEPHTLTELRVVTGWVEELEARV